MRHTPPCPPLIALAAIALAIAPLAACRQPSASLTISHVAPRRVSLTFQLPPERHALQLAPNNAYTRADIFHLAVKLFRVEANGSETLVKALDVAEDQLDLPVTFSGLEAMTTYRAYCFAYAMPGTDPKHLISHLPHSFTEVAVQDDDAVPIQPLTVQLRSVMPLVGEWLSPYLPLSAGLDLAVDASGAAYVADPADHTIKQVVGASVTVFAGSAGLTGAVEGGPGTGRMDQPRGLARDSGGNLFVADSGNHRIRKVDPSGVLTTYAGSAQGTLLDDPAQFNYPSAVAVGPADEVYVADNGNFAVRKIVSGVVTTLAGDGTSGYQDGPGSQAQFEEIRALATDGAGNVYVADSPVSPGSNGRIRKIRPDGYVTTFWLGGPNPANDTPQPADEVMLDAIRDMGFDDAGNFYVSVNAGLVKRDRRGRARRLVGAYEDDPTIQPYNVGKMVVGPQGGITLVETYLEKLMRLK